jgi:hypothetical protein
MMRVRKVELEDVGLISCHDRQKERASTIISIPQLLEEIEAVVECKEGVADVLLGMMDLLAVDEGGSGIGAVLAEHVDELHPNRLRCRADIFEFQSSTHTDSAQSRRPSHGKPRAVVCSA